MQPDGNIVLSLEWCNRADVIDMRVSDPDRFYPTAALFDCVDDALRLASRIYDCYSVGLWILDEVAVFLKRSDSDLRDVHPATPAPPRGPRGTARLSAGGASI